jgi:hypothetical protein
MSVIMDIFNHKPHFLELLSPKLQTTIIGYFARRCHSRSFICDYRHINIITEKNITFMTQNSKITKIMSVKKVS